MIDLHCDTIWKIWQSDGKEHLRKNNFSVDYAKLADGNVRGQCFALFTPMHDLVPENKRNLSPWEIASELYAVFQREIEDASIPQMRLVSDLDSHCPHAILTTEEGGLLEGDISRLSILKDWGVKIFGLTWNWENELAYPNSKDPEVMSRGLKEKGIEAVEECGRLGIIIDVSHLSDGGFYDVAKYSKLPFVATHSNARCVTDVTRNLSDDMLRLLASCGGVCGLNLCPAFLHEEKAERKEDAESRIEDMVRHVLHVYETAGEDVLAIGTDFDGIDGKLEIPSSDKLYLLYEALGKKGMKPSVLDKMWYKNAERVLFSAEV